MYILNHDFHEEMNKTDYLFDFVSQTYFMEKIIILIWRLLKFSYQYQNCKLFVCFNL